MTLVAVSLSIHHCKSALAETENDIEQPKLPLWALSVAFSSFSGWRQCSALYLAPIRHLAPVTPKDLATSVIVSFSECSISLIATNLSFSFSSVPKDWHVLQSVVIPRYYMDCTGLRTYFFRWLIHTANELNVEPCWTRRNHNSLHCLLTIKSHQSPKEVEVCPFFPTEQTLGYKFVRCHGYTICKTFILPCMSFLTECERCPVLKANWVWITLTGS